MPEEWNLGYFLIYVLAAIIGRGIYEFLKWRYKIWREDRKWR